MIEKEVRIIEISGLEIGVERVQETACGNCSEICGTSLLGPRMKENIRRFEVEGDGSWKPGDRIVIGLPERALVAGSLRIYLIPALFLLLGAGLGQGFGGRVFFLSTDAGSIIGGIFGLALAFGMLKRISVGSFTPMVIRRRAD
jgi:sigma-E factor negative regulatory protein RseC